MHHKRNGGEEMKEKTENILIILMIISLIGSSVFVLISVYYTNKSIQYTNELLFINTHHEEITNCLDERLKEFKCDTCLGGYNEGFDDNKDEAWEYCIDKIKTDDLKEVVTE